MSLRKPGRETDKEVLAYINGYSKSMCLAKWYNATIWLGSGQSTSCHHPPAHQIDVAAIAKNPSAIHNTLEKKNDRAMMQIGKRPPGCDYCWKIEDMSGDNISDRVYKSVIYNDADAIRAQATDSNEDINLKTLEIAFDRTCNFACSYCNPAFSTEWVKDIKQNGPYTDLLSDGRNHFTHTHDSAQPFKINEENPYIEAFFKWWESDLHDSLQELRLTGGEPLMSPHTWRLFDWFIANKTDMQFALNSNLGAKNELIDKLIEVSHNMSNFQLYTSNESIGVKAEYIRDGMDCKQWSENLIKIIEEGNVKGLHMMCTIGALSLDGFTNFLDILISMKSLYGKEFPTFSINILRFPSFQSALILPNNIRTMYNHQLRQWLKSNARNPLLHEMEINQVKRLIDYLDVLKTPISSSADRTVLCSDFKKFFTQYDERRGKNFTKTFPDLADWYNAL
jgi:organic radical activating enzyme